MSDSEIIRVFCGGDRSQQLPFRVLAHSLRRHSARPIEITAIDNGMAPTPADPRHAPYTEFSFARFAIPAMCGHAGRAVYMDSDMLVFADIGELWDTAMDGAKVAIEIGSRNQADRGKHAAVMLLDCAALDWDVDRIVADLGARYDYNALMAIDPLLAPGEMRELIASGWNDLDHYQAGQTRNLHYTEIRTQPWVYAAHPHGKLWVDEVALMLADGELTESDLRDEVTLGYVRPSLLSEMAIGSGEATKTASVPTPEALLAEDRASGFVAHRVLLARFAKRKRAIAQLRCEHASARQPWLAPWHKLLFRLRYGE